MKVVLCGLCGKPAGEVFKAKTPHQVFHGACAVEAVHKAHGLALPVTGMNGKAFESLVSSREKLVNG